MRSRKIAYCECEGGEYKLWPKGIRNFNPPIVFWSDGKIKDDILASICASRNEPIIIRRNTREEAKRIEDYVLTLAQDKLRANG
jgi:hypothetical protein